MKQFITDAVLLLDDICQQDYKTFYNKAFQMTHDAEESRDIVQAAFENTLKIIQKGKTILSTREDISRYLMRITINLGKTYYKKKYHPNFQVESVEDMEQTFDTLARESSLFDFDDKYRAVDLWDLIEKSSAKLPKRSKEYFMWRLYYGLDDNEIAVIMGVKRASLCVLKNRTLNHLRNEMKKCLGGD